MLSSFLHLPASRQNHGIKAGQFFRYSPNSAFQTSNCILAFLAMFLGNISAVLEMCTFYENRLFRVAVNLYGCEELDVGFKPIKKV